MAELLCWYFFNRSNLIYKYLDMSIAHLELNESTSAIKMPEFDSA